MGEPVTVRCYHCGEDLGVEKVTPTASWGDGTELTLRPPLGTLECPRCHRLTVAAGVGE